jgi:ketosteroid isomerase-like protein
VTAESQIELARQAIDAFNRHDPDALLEIGGDDFVIDWSNSIAPNQGIYSGREGVREFVDDQWTMFDEVRIEPEEFVPRGNHVIVPITVHGRGRDGVLVKATSAQLYTFEDGRPARMTMYQDRDEALEAAAAEE